MEIEKPASRVDPGERQHHVGNLFSRLRTILARTVDAGGSTDVIIDHFRGRLDALSRREVARAANPGGSVDLEELIREELQDFWLGNDPRITIAGADLDLNHDTALSLGLAMHELTTNATKFGALSPGFDHALLSVAWSVQDKILHLAWQESGIALVSGAPVKEGFGREYLEQGLPYELNAEVQVERRPGVLTWHIRVPLRSTSMAIDEDQAICQ